VQMKKKKNEENEAEKTKGKRELKLKKSGAQIAFETKIGHEKKRGKQRNSEQKKQ
jgi:hypothetical protein